MLVFLKKLAVLLAESVRGNLHMHRDHLGSGSCLAFMCFVGPTVSGQPTSTISADQHSATSCCLEQNTIN